MIVVTGEVMEENKKKRCQITFDIDPEMKRIIKIMAADQCISVNLFVHRALQKAINRQIKIETGPVTIEDLE